MDERELRATRDRARAREWALVLSAEGIDAQITERGTACSLSVSAHEGARAEAILEAYERENKSPGSRRAAAREVTGLGPLNAALGVALAMLAFYAVTGPRDPAVSWFARGSADAARILSGELWRSVTALCLHADATHVAANAIFGTLFLAAAGRSLGPGLAFALALLAGAGGNLTNAALRGPPHVAIGASTAVFGAVGVLAGWHILHRAREGHRGRRVALPLAAALGLLAMLGTGVAPVDIWAHFFGLALGVPIGAAAGRLVEQPPRWPTQTACALAAAAGIVLCWRWALA